MTKSHVTYFYYSLIQTYSNIILAIIPKCRAFYPLLVTLCVPVAPQCRSSKGMQRGHCWCVDEFGITLPTHVDDEGTLPCDGE